MSLIERIEKNKKEITRLKQEAYQLGFTEGEQRTIKEFLAEWAKLDYWITDNQERTKDEYDRKIVDWYELHKYILFEKEKWEKKLTDSGSGGEF